MLAAELSGKVLMELVCSHQLQHCIDLTLLAMLTLLDTPTTTTLFSPSNQDDRVLQRHIFFRNNALLSLVIMHIDPHISMHELSATLLHDPGAPLNRPIRPRKRSASAREIEENPWLCARMTKATARTAPCVSPHIVDSVSFEPHE